MSGDTEQEYFADGITEDIITALSRIRWLLVTARNSTFSYKGISPDVRKVARELDVRYVLEGSVRKAGAQIRITAQLIDASSGNHIWSERFDGTLEDVFDLQDKITNGVVGTIEPAVRFAEIQRAQRNRTENLSAYDLYLRAHWHSIAATPNDRAAALKILEEALALDPEYLEAHALSAWCYEQRFSMESGNPVDKQAALRHARIALEGKSNDPATLANIGRVIAFLDGDYRTAMVAIDRALQTNANDTMALSAGAQILTLAGDYDRALEMAKQAKNVPSMHFNAWPYGTESAIARAEFHAGNYVAAEAAARRALDSSDRFLAGHVLLIASCIRGGNQKAASAAVDRMLERFPNFRISNYADRLLFHPEQRDALVAALRETNLPE